MRTWPTEDIAITSSFVLLRSCHERAVRLVYERAERYVAYAEQLSQHVQLVSVVLDANFVNSVVENDLDEVGNRVTNHAISAFNLPHFPLTRWLHCRRFLVCTLSSRSCFSACLCCASCKVASDNVGRQLSCLPSPSPAEHRQDAWHCSPGGSEGRVHVRSTQRER